MFCSNAYHDCSITGEDRVKKRKRQKFKMLPGITNGFLMILKYFSVVGVYFPQCLVHVLSQLNFFVMLALVHNKCDPSDIAGTKIY